MIIKGQRRSGKTSELIYLSHKTGSVIITTTEKEAERVYKIAKKIELEIPKPLSVNGLQNAKGLKIENILIDEFDLVLEQLLGYKIRAMTTSETVVKLFN